MKPIIIDNFLDEGYFKMLTDLICARRGAFEWFYGPYLEDDPTDKEEPLNYFFTHTVYSHHVPHSPHFQTILPFCEKIHEEQPTKSLIRIRANIFPNTNTVEEYPLHTDEVFSHTAALISLNTCDGYTGIEDENGIVQKYHSVANRVLFFDAGERHCSTTTTTARARFNVIVNYL